MTEKTTFTPADRLRCLFRKEFYMILPNYICFLIPMASLMAYLSHRFIDKWLGWTLPIPYPFNFIVFGFCLIFGFFGLLWTYSYLILEGGGGPCPPFTAKTKCMVKTGPYKYVRHPSILAKLLGVIGLGVAFQSVSFLIIVIPTLLSFSLYNNYIFQEKPMIKQFGEEFTEYKKNTPMLIPDFAKLLGLKK
jgi:protein-S-isoprenylcysteine O-methyltransferase Ste14